MNRQQFKLETDLNTLRAFVAVAEEGGFSSAAKRIHRTQSAVSVQIAKLEDQLNAKLFERTSRSVSVTPAGETFLSYARRILELSDEAALAVSPAEEKALLRIGIAEYLAPRHLDVVLTRFRQTFPDCGLNLTLGLGGTLLGMLDQDELDLVVAGPDRPGGQKLWDEPLVWTGTYETTGGSPHPLDLVLLPPPCIYRKMVFDSLTQMALPWRIAMEANSFEAVQTSIRAGLGITILPQLAIHDGMTVITEKLPELPNSSVLSYTRPGHSHPYVDPFIDLLVARVETSAGTNDK